MSLIKIILILIAVISASAIEIFECQCFEIRGINWGPECDSIPEEDRVCMQKTEYHNVLGNCVHKTYINWQKTCKFVRGYDKASNYWEFKR